mgnify:CR=1 FL=1
MEIIRVIPQITIELAIPMLVLLWVLVLLEHFLGELVTITIVVGQTIIVGKVLLAVTAAVTGTMILGRCLVLVLVL